MTEWDNTIAPILRDIEWRAKTMASYARGLTASVELLTARPEWETRAEDEMATLETNLSEALARVQAARHAYRVKQVIMEAAE